MSVTVHLGDGRSTAHPGIPAAPTINGSATSATTPLACRQSHRHRRCAAPEPAAPATRSTGSRRKPARGCATRRLRRSSAAPAGVPVPRARSDSPRNRRDERRTPRVRTARGCRPDRHPAQGRRARIHSRRHRTEETFRPHHVPPDGPRGHLVHRERRDVAQAITSCWPRPRESFARSPMRHKEYDIADGPAHYVTLRLPCENKTDPLSRGNGPNRTKLLPRTLLVHTDGIVPIC